MTGPLTWARVFALGLALRMVLLAAVFPSLDDLMPVLVAGAAVHVGLAAAVLARWRLLTAFAIYGAAQGLVLPMVYGSTPWVWVNTAYAALLTGAGLLAWRERRAPRDPTDA